MLTVAQAFKFIQKQTKHFKTISPVYFYIKNMQKQQVSFLNYNSKKLHQKFIKTTEKFKTNSFNYISRLNQKLMILSSHEYIAIAHKCQKNIDNMEFTSRSITLKIPHTHS